MPEIIAVQPGDSLDGLLAEIRRRQAVNAGKPVVLWVPRGIPLMQAMETYQALKQAAPDVLVLSPEARVVGMALVFGVDAATSSGPPLARVPPPARDRAAREGPGALPLALRAGASPPSVPAVPPDRAGAGADTGSGHRAAPPAERSVTGMPGSRPMVRRTAPLGPAPPRPEANGAEAGPGPAGASGLISDVPADGAGGTGSLAPQEGSRFGATDAPEAAPISFVEWLAMPSEPDRPGATAAPPADLDLSQLPDWLRSTLADSPPLVPAAPPLGLRCPHCGEALDKDELLRMLAAGWGE